MPKELPPATQIWVWIVNLYFKFKLNDASINNWFLGDDELKIDSGADDDFEEIDDSLHKNIESYISGTTSLPLPLPNKLISIIKHNIS